MHTGGQLQEALKHHLPDVITGCRDRELLIVWYGLPPLGKLLLDVESDGADHREVLEVLLVLLNRLSTNEKNLKGEISRHVGHNRLEITRMAAQNVARMNGSEKEGKIEDMVREQIFI